MSDNYDKADQQRCLNPECTGLILDYEHILIDEDNNEELHTCPKCGITFTSSDDIDEMFESYLKRITSSITIILICFILTNRILIRNDDTKRE